MKKLILSAFMLAAFAAVSNAQTPQTPQTQPTQQKPAHDKKMSQHNKMSSDTSKGNMNKNWGTDKKMKGKGRRSADSTGVK